MSANGEANVKQKIRERYEATPAWPCKGCGETFKPPFGISWGNVKYCQKSECQHAKYANRQKSVKESNKRYLARQCDMYRSTRRSGVGKDKDKKWPCQDCGKMSDGRLHCPACKARILARDDSWLSEYSVGTIDLSRMGVMR